MDIHSLKGTMLLCPLLLAAGIFFVAFRRLRGSSTKRICAYVLVVIASADSRMESMKDCLRIRLSCKDFLGESHSMNSCRLTDPLRARGSKDCLLLPASIIRLGSLFG